MKLDLTMDSFIQRIRTAAVSHAAVTTHAASILLKENIRLSNDKGHKSIEFYATFKLSNGQEQKYRISFWQYHQLRAGTEGTLSCQGSLYKGFREDS